MKTWSIKFDSKELKLLASLAKNDLKDIVHAAVTAPMPSVNKTAYIVNRFEELLALQDVFRLQVNDQGFVYKTLPSAVVSYFLQLLNEVQPDSLPEDLLVEYLSLGPQLSANIMAAIGIKTSST